MRQICDYLSSYGFQLSDHHFDKNHKGSPAPLWNNFSKRFFFYFAIVNFVIFLLIFIAPATIVTLGIYNSENLEESNKNFKTCLEEIQREISTISLLLALFALIMNGLISSYLSRIDYASDQEWSRYLLFYSIAWAFLILTDTGLFLDFINFIEFSSDSKVFELENVEQCVRLFEINKWLTLSVAGLIGVLAFTQMLSVVQLMKRFLLTSGIDKFAIIEDSNIQVAVD